MSTTVTLSSKYQIVIPQAARSAVALRRGRAARLVQKRSGGHRSETEEFHETHRGASSRHLAWRRGLFGRRASRLVSGDFLGAHALVLIGTALWIYHFEGHPRFGLAAGKVIQGVVAGKFRGVTSELILLELTVRPLQLARQDVADEYELLHDHFPNLELAPVTREILLLAAGLRARHRLRTPDAIQVATAIQRGATLAVTNDEAWRTLPGIETVILSDLVKSIDSPPGRL